MRIVTEFMIFSLLKYGLKIAYTDNNESLLLCDRFLYNRDGKQRMKTFLSQQHATNRNKDSNNKW